MKTIRKKNEDLNELLKELKIGDYSIYDECTNYEITRVPGGYIYRNEYSGLCFVPEVQAVPGIKNSVTKAEPKKAVTK